MRAFSSLILLLIALSATDSVAAGTLYRCKDKAGNTAFTSSRAGYSQCKLIGNFPASKPTPAPAATGTKPAATGAVTQPTQQVEFRTAGAGAEPKAVPVPAGAKPTVSRGAVYKFTKNGVTHYTNRRPAHGAKVLFTYIETCFACGAAPGVDFDSVGLNLTAYADEVTAATAEHGVDPALVRAIMHAESAFNPNAVSRVGAQGLMQLMPATASRFGVSSAFEPSENIKGGVSYLAWLTKRFDGDLQRVAAGYNAGEGAVDKYDGVPPYQETLRYVERVGILHSRYQAAMAPATASAAAAAPPAAGAAN